MPKASQIADELRKVLRELEANPDMELPYLFAVFSCYDKESFRNALKIIPRPFDKVYERDEIRLDYGKNYQTDPLHMWIKAPRNIVCRLVEPAKEAVYECEPLLSEDDESALTD